MRTDSDARIGMHVAHEVVAIGRIGVDLYPLQAGVPLSEVTSFARFLGGSSTNVAVGAARLGHSSALISKVGVDGFGDFAERALRGYGVSTRWLGRHASLRTPLAFAELFAPDHFPLTFYRDPSAPDMHLTPADIDELLIAEAGLVWISGGSFATEPSRQAVEAALVIRGDQVTIFDLDYRPSMWRDPGEATAALLPVLDKVAIVIGNEQEFAVATGRDNFTDAVTAVLDRGAKLVILKRGPLGVLARAASGEEVQADAFDIEVLCGLGAGDAFGAAVCHGLLNRWPVPRTIEFANAAGAIVASRLACSDAMPTADEVDIFLAERVGA